MITPKCLVCGHRELYHTDIKDPFCIICSESYILPTEKVFHEFKQDNLDLIERVAKAKNLI